jgi:hypothetical protein
MYFPGNATINYTVQGGVAIGKDNRNQNSSPTVSITSGADLWSGATVFNSSQVNMSAGRVSLWLIGLDSSTTSITGGLVEGSLITGQAGSAGHTGGTLLMSGGTAGSADIDRRGTLSMHGGSINGSVRVNNGSSFYLDGTGLISGEIQVGFESQAYISGGFAQNGIRADSNSRVSITGGRLSQTVRAAGVSTVNISGGDTKFVTATDAGTLNLSGSIADDAAAHDLGVLNMTGGATGAFGTHNSSKGNLYDGAVLGDLIAFDDSTIEVYGGTVSGAIKAYGTVNIHGSSKATADFARLASAAGLPELLVLDDGLVQLFGRGLEQTLIDPDFAYESDDITGSFSKYALTGILQDGTDIAGSFLLVENGAGARFALISQVPEARTVSLFGLGIPIVLVAARRRGRWQVTRDAGLVARCG